MSKMKYTIAKIKYILQRRNNEVINDYFRKCGLCIGENTHIFSDLSGGEGFLISIGNNTTISNNVACITHDASVSHYLDNVTDIFGEIKIGNNCFIGMNVTILPGVSIADNCVIGAGSVVTKSIIENGSVWAGNPARKICDVSSLAEKYEKYAVNLCEHTTNRRDEIYAKVIKR